MELLCATSERYGGVTDDLTEGLTGHDASMVGDWTDEVNVRASFEVNAAAG